MDVWVIFDDNGVIEQGSEDDLRATFDNPDFEWTGDLVLAKVEGRKR
jgi:hypothetical protein